MTWGRWIAVASIALVGCTAPTSTTETHAARIAVAPASTESIVLAKSAPRPAVPLRVIVGGDVIPHRPSLTGQGALEDALAPLKPLFGKADAIVANYEAATGALDKRSFKMAYAAPPDWMNGLTSSGVTSVTIANNHACDLDYDGVAATLGAASKAGLVVLGGDNKADPWAPRTIAERGGKRVCAVAWTTFVNAPGGCARTARLAVAPENAEGRKKVAAAIERSRAECDATIAIVHGGTEYAAQTPSMIRTARQAADSGADAVVIHHPHVASPVVVHAAKDGRKVPIFASVGNLASNQGESWKASLPAVNRQNRRLVCVNGWTRLGVLADLSFTFDGGRRVDWGFHLLWTDNAHADDKAAAPHIATRLLDPEKDKAIVERLGQDEVGPVELFEDPCWAERPVLTDGDRTPSPRCGSAAPPT